jgi:uncharacterized Fe-S center protein
VESIISHTGERVPAAEEKGGVPVVADVFFSDLRARSEAENKVARMRRLFSEAGFPQVIRERDLTAVKLHFGERGMDTFVSPVLVRAVVDRIREAGGRPFLTDTATLYSGSRSNAVDHLTTAILHGFDFSVAGAPVIIADGLRSTHFEEVPVQGRHFSRVLVAGDIAAADSMIVISHYKGHMLSGFGGALKNLAMGCAPAAGKREEHSAKAMAAEAKCQGCGTCVPVCPAGALSLPGDKVAVDRDRCIGCGECMTVCPEGALEFDWEVDLPPFIERMMEYAMGAFQSKKGRIGFYNLLLSVTPDCDCVPWSDAPIVPDIGILASTDPVAIDAASLDLVNSGIGLPRTLLTHGHGKGEDKFRGVWPHTDGEQQLRYAEHLGLGTRRYRLVRLEGGGEC